MEQLSLVILFFGLYSRGVKILLGTVDTIFLQNYSINRRKAS